MHFKRTHAAITTAALAITLGLAGTPLYAYGATSAELQQQLDVASEQLNSLYSQAEQAGYDLHTVQADLDKTNESIAQTEAEIAEEQEQLTALQEELGVLASDQYKGSTPSLLSLLLNAESFDSLLSSMRYADKAAEHRQGLISESKALQESLAEKKASLEKDKIAQEELVAEQQVKADAANAAAAEAQAYYDQLSDEVKAKIEEEQAAAREQARLEAERAQQEAEQAQQNQNQNNSGGSTSGGGSSSGGSSRGGSTSGGSSSGGSSSGGSSSGGGSHTTSGSAQAMVNRAWGIIGSGYSYTGYRWTGDPSTSYFTCSGVIDYALGLPTNSNSPESLYASVRSRMTTNVSELAYGDLVFFRSGGRAPGHVGIYIGGGQMIDSIPGGGVAVRTLDFIGGFMGGGPIV